MSSVSILSLVALCATVGAFIDFILGKENQKKVRNWFELTWYKYSDIKWRNFGNEEAKAYVRLFDRLFGRKLLCRQRALSVLAIALVGTLCSFTAVLIRGWPVHDISPRVNLLWEPTAAALALSISLSITRFLAVAVATVRVQTFILNLLLFAITLMVHYLLTAIWLRLVPAAIEIFGLLYFLRVGPTESNSLILTEMGRLIETNVVAMGDFLRRPLAFDSGLTVLAWAVYDRFHDTRGLVFVEGMTTQFLMYAGNLLRIAVAFMFVASFFFEWLLRRPAFFIWARVVESEKPIFTMLFAALGALATTVRELLKVMSP